MRYELNHEGHIVEYDGDVQLIANAESTIIQLFSQGVYECTLMSRDGSIYKISVLNTVNQDTKIYEVYYGNIRNESRNDKEKKIQLNSKDPRSTSEEALIIGIYCYNSGDELSDLIVSAWSVDETVNYPSNPSIRGINIDLFQGAKIHGLIRHEYRTNAVCVFRPEFIYYYLNNRLTLHEGLQIQIDTSTSSQSNEQNIPTKIPRNKIIYGAPGTGKSYELRDQATDAGFNEDNIIRITFHPNYSYQQFVGSYKPSPIYKNILQEGAELYGSDKSTILEDLDKKEPLIDYRFVAGPLMKQLVYALNNPEKNYLLIIEEINRAPVSSVFGDVFQLLDRKEDGTSEYSITFNEEAMSFLRGNRIIQTEIKLPKNLFIWATMNSADQGVMPLDAAFKRRWAFEYLPLNEKQSKVENRKIKFQNVEYNWNSFRKQINDKLKDLGIVEDKLIGPFFMNSNELSDENSIKNKLLLYLRDDVVRHNPESLFKKKTYSDIIDMYSNGDNIFVNLEIKGEAPSADAEVGQE